MAWKFSIFSQSSAILGRILLIFFSISLVFIFVLNLGIIGLLRRSVPVNLKMLLCSASRVSFRYH